jgi:hypothetical protein
VISSGNLTSLRSLISIYERSYLPRLTDIIGGKGIDDKDDYITFTMFTRKARFVCSCDDLRYFTNETTIRFPGIDNVECEGPDEIAKGDLLSQRVFNSTCSNTNGLITGCADTLECVIDIDKLAISIRAVSVLTELPPTLPALPVFRQSWRHFLDSYYIDFSNNHIRTISERHYLTRTRLLNLSFNEIAHISDRAAALSVLGFVRDLYLNDNQLKTLPRSLENVSYKSIQLFNNPWTCDCNSAWMKSWLGKSFVVWRERIRCNTSDVRKGKRLVELEDSLFQCGYIWSTAQSTALVIALTTVSVAVVVASILFVIYAKRHWLYAKFNLHPFDVDECAGEDVIYDVFVSYATEDEFPFVLV